MNKIKLFIAPVIILSTITLSIVAYHYFKKPFFNNHYEAAEIPLHKSRLPLPGQIIHDPQNASWLVYNRDSDDDGELDPFFLAGPGDPENFLYRGKRNTDGTRTGDQAAIINKLKHTGANSIYFQVIRSHGGDGEPDHNPFINSDPSNDINTKILDQWESWLKEMDENEIVAYLFLYDDAINVSKNLNWPLDHSNNLHPDERNFIYTIVNRFKHHKHLIWVVMEEAEEMGDDYIIHSKKIAEAIRQADNHNHVIAIHRLTGISFKEYIDAPNISQFAIQLKQDNADALHNEILSAWKNAAGRYNLNMSETSGHPKKSTSELRHMNWATAMAGAYVMVLGMNIIDTPKTDLDDLGKLRRFMELTNFNKMAPDDSLAYEGTIYVLAQPGNSYIAYARNLTENIGIKNMRAGSYDFTWFDPISGQTIIQHDITVLSGNNSWSKPASFGPETVLHIKRH